MERKAAGLASIKTAVRSRIHAKPNLGDSDYLDLFLLVKNRNRIQQEMQQLQERLQRLSKDILVIDEAMAKIRESVAEDSVEAPVVAPDKKLPRSMKKLALRY